MRSSPKWLARFSERQFERGTLVGLTSVPYGELQLPPDPSVNHAELMQTVSDALSRSL